MNSKGRIENSVKNSLLGVIVQVSNILLGLIVRTVFIHCLNVEYLGVNGLFSNILTILSLAEMGVGEAVVYNMYKPIANKDYVQIAKLMNLYQQAYRAIGGIVAVVGLCIIPFLNFIIKDQPDIENLTLIYILFLVNTVFSYFFAYKRSIFSADQQERVLHAFKLAFYVLRSILQIAILFLTRNFILYLIIQIICTGLENIFISVYANKKYPFLIQYRNQHLETSETKTIFNNIKALFTYKIGSTILNGTDNIIISAFDGVVSVGLLSNYTLITGSVQMLISQITSSLTGSIGNFIAKEDSSRHEEMFDKINFLSFLIYGFAFIMLMAAINPFIILWAGESYCLDYFTVLVLCLNIYILGMMNTTWTFRSTMGLFMYGKWRPLFSAVVNVVVSIFLANYFGLVGVLLGTTITRLTTNLWYDPYIVYKYGFQKKAYNFYRKWLIYLIVIFADIGILFIVYQIEGVNPFFNLVLNIVIGCIVFMASVLIVFGRTDEFEYSMCIFKTMVNKIKLRIVNIR